MGGTACTANDPKSTVASALGMACFWAFFRYSVFFELIYPTHTHITLAGYPDNETLPFAVFLIALVGLSLACLARWRDILTVLERHRNVAACCALMGSIGVALTLASARIADASWLIWPAAPLIALGFLTCLLTWGSYFARHFGPLQVFTCALSYLLSLVTFGPLYSLGTWVAPLSAVAIPMGSVAGWLIAAQSDQNVQRPIQTSEEAGLRRLLNPTIWLFIAFLLAGSVVRGAVDALGLDSGLRFQLSAPITALLVIACAVFAWLRRDANACKHPEGSAVTQFSLGCWIALSILFFSGVFALFGLSDADMGGSLVVISRSMLEIVFWILLCDLAHRNRVASLPLFLICSALVEAASWALSYVAVPLFLAKAAPDLDTGSVTLTLAAAFSLTGVVTVILGFTLVALGRRRPGTSTSDWLLTPAAPLSDKQTVADATPAEKLEKERGLTTREALVAVGYAHGFSLSKVSNDLGITTAAAQTNIKSAYRKLGIHSKNELIEIVDALREDG